MNGNPPPRMLPLLSAVGMLAFLVLLCLLPFIMLDAMNSAMLKLHLAPPVAFLAVLLILLGSFVNVPVYEIERNEPQPVELIGVLGLWGWTERFRRVRSNTVIAVNVGGCVIPLLIAFWQAMYVLDIGGGAGAMMLVAAAANIVACYFAARPVAGLGITMPGLLSPLVAVGVSWLMLMESTPAADALRPSIAFVAGVLGPVVGADLLHLKDISRVSVGMLSIGGAGTFDGIVLSGILAALLA